MEDDDIMSQVSNLIDWNPYQIFADPRPYKKKRLKSACFFIFRADRSFYMVSLWQHYHRSLSGQVSHHHYLRHGLGPVYQSGHVYVKHVVRMLNPLQVQTTLHCHHEQDGG